VKARFFVIEPLVSFVSAFVNKSQETARGNSLICIPEGRHLKPAWRETEGSFSIHEKKEGLSNTERGDREVPGTRKILSYVGQG